MKVIASKCVIFRQIRTLCTNEIGNQVTKILTNLRILDNVRFDQKFLRRKQKAQKQLNTSASEKEKERSLNARREPQEESRPSESDSKQRSVKRKVSAKNADAIELAPSAFAEDVRKRQRMRKSSPEQSNAVTRGRTKDEANDIQAVGQDADRLPVPAESSSASQSSQRPKKKRSRVKKGLDKLAGSVSERQAAVLAKPAKSIGGSLSAPADAVPTTQTEAESTTKLEDLVRMRSSVVGIVEVPNLASPGKPSKGKRQNKRLPNTRGMAWEKEDVLALLTSKKPEASVVKGWD